MSDFPCVEDHVRRRALEREVHVHIHRRATPGQDEADPVLRVRNAVDDTALISCPVQDGDEQSMQPRSKRIRPEIELSRDCVQRIEKTPDRHLAIAHRAQAYAAG